MWQRLFEFFFNKRHFSDTYSLASVPISLKRCTSLVGLSIELHQLSLLKLVILVTVEGKLAMKKEIESYFERTERKQIEVAVFVDIYL